MASVDSPAVAGSLAELLDQLGGISSERIRRQPAPGQATEQDVITAETRENRLCELVDGTLVEKAMGYEESTLAVALASLLREFVNSRNLGKVNGEAGMLRLFPGLIRIPDVAYASWNRFAHRAGPRQPVPDIVPDLVVGILSESNTAREMSRKRDEYFAAGVQLMWEIDPADRTVAVFTDPESKRLLTEADQLDGGRVLLGFSVALKELFSELDRMPPVDN